MNENILISIIIPCYNSGAFLQSTIDMLRKEDLSDCELIIIDDGSTDNTLDVIQKNADNIIYYITRENRGVSVSRNEGLQMARGKYIYFLDSDDAVTPGTIKYYKNKITEHEAYDFFAFGYKMIGIDGKETNYISSGLNGQELRNERCADLFFRGLLFLNICSVLLCREFLIANNLLLEEGIIIGEDFDFLRKVAMKAKRVLYDDRVCFIYNRRKGSATDGGQCSYGLNNFQSLVLSFKCADLAKGILDERTINYFLAARYSVHLKSYLKSPFVNVGINTFFLKHRSYLYKPLNKGRKKVMLVICAFRVLPIKSILKLMK